MTIDCEGNIENPYNWHEEIEKALKPLEERITFLENKLADESGLDGGNPRLTSVHLSDTGDK